MAKWKISKWEFGEMGIIDLKLGEIILWRNETVIDEMELSKIKDNIKIKCILITF